MTTSNPSNHETLRDALAELRDAPPQQIDALSYDGLSDADRKRLTDGGYDIYTGKVRDMVAKGGNVWMVHSDRLSAFDKMIGHVPYKGVLLADVAEYWLKAAQAITPTHLLERVSPRTLKVRHATPIKAEVIVRGYLAGSMMRAYQEGRREFCGEQLPDGLLPFHPLPQPIITPTTKAEAFDHDEETTPERLIRAGVCSPDEWQYISKAALELFSFGQSVYRDYGWILVDTKYEFGRTANGEVIIIDEVHTPDSSRLWDAASYEERLTRHEAPVMLDKEIVRRALMAKGFHGEGKPPAVASKDLCDLGLVYEQVASKLRGQLLSQPEQSRGSEVDAIVSET